MKQEIEAIYENGILKLPALLPFKENARVRVTIEGVDGDAERKMWLKESENSLMKIWDNSADDVYNELLAG